MKVTAILAVTILAAAHAFSSSVSVFGGKVLVTGTSNGAMLEMKKGKPNVPPQMRSQYNRQKEMAAQREQIIAASKPGPDGLPVFNLFVRTSKANVSSVVSVALYRTVYGGMEFHRLTFLFQMWYPCGSFKGDEKSRALASNYRDKGFLAGISKNQLDSGIEGSLYRDLAKLNETVMRAYPQLRKSKDELQYGYRLAFEGLTEDEPICEVTPKEQKGVLDNIKGVFGG
jgi:hypothetical protein